MVRYHLRCKNSLLLLKRKFLLRVGDKSLCFFIEFTFLSCFIYLHCYISVFYFTKWCYSLEVDFLILVPHWILVVTFVRTVIIVHGSLPFWILLCGVYHPYGLIVCYQLYNHSFTAICLAKLLVSNLPVSYKWDIKDCALFGCCCAWWGF